MKNLTIALSTILCASVVITGCRKSGANDEKMACMLEIQPTAFIDFNIVEPSTGRDLFFSPVQKLIDAVGSIIEFKGYTGLSATYISNAAGLSRRLITLYFGTVDNLIETYVRGKDYRLSASGNTVGLIKDNTGENTWQILECLLQNQFDYFFNNAEMQKIILWQRSESTEIMKEIYEEREQLSKSFFALSDKELGKDVDLRAVSALMVAGIYYLVLHAKSTDTLFCEIDLNAQEGMSRIKKAISMILKNTYDYQPTAPAK